MITRGFRTDEAGGVPRGTPAAPGRWRWRVDATCPVHGLLAGRTDRASKKLGRWAWGTQADNRVRPEHAALEGMEFEAGEKHPTEGEPGDAYGCRCFKIPLPDAFGGREGMTQKQFRAVERVSKRAKAEGLRRGAAFQAKMAKKREAKKAADQRGDSRPRLLEVRLDSSKIEITPEGYWLVRGVAGAGDMLLDYPEFGRSEWRPLDELVRAAPSLVGKPITVEHETGRPYGTVDPDNYADASVGHVIAAEVVDKLLHFEALITTRRGQKAITPRAKGGDGLDKLSLAYSLDPAAARTPTTLPDGRKVGGVQRDIHFDNLTLTDSPRAGEAAALRLDKVRTMQRFKFTITRTDSRTGKPSKVAGLLPALMLAGLEAEAKRTDDARRVDEDLPVGKLTVEKSDGTKVDLTLPDGMLGDVLAMVGAAPAGEGAEQTEADPVAEAEAAMASDMEGEDDEQLVAMDSDPEARGDSTRRRRAAATPPRRTDAQLEQRIASKVEAKVGEQLRVDAYRRDIEGRVRGLFGDRSLASLDAPGMMAGAIRVVYRADATKVARADQLARDARRTDDAVARGRALGALEGLLEQALDKRRTDEAELERQRADSLPVIPGGFAAQFFAPAPPDGEKRADAVTDSRARMIKRRSDKLTARKKPAAA